MSDLIAEVAQIGDLLRNQLERPTQSFGGDMAALMGFPIERAYFVARGSSAAAATIIAHDLADRLGVITTRLPPSLVKSASCNGRFKGSERTSLVVAVSQSGASPDLLESVWTMRDRGAHVLCITNSPQSILAQQSQTVIDIGAGIERSVAATKSVALSVSAGLRLCDALTGSEQNRVFLQSLPETLSEKACAIANGLELMRTAASGASYLIGRGPALGVAQELGLKCKEMFQWNVEAFSSAEFLHGPIEAALSGSPVIALDLGGAGDISTRQAADAVRQLGGRVAMWGLPAEMMVGAPPSVRALCLLVHCYRQMAALHGALGLPDQPIALQKVTRTH
jgi:glucosamine--fructose-6-phosphate aminotransferase (isomerizing)